MRGGRRLYEAALFDKNLRAGAGTMAMSGNRAYPRGDTIG